MLIPRSPWKPRPVSATSGARDTFDTFSILGTNTAVLKASDLPEEIQTRLFELAAQALATYSVEKDYATFLKKELDHLYGATWHVIVGKSFGSYVTHEHGFFCYFYIGELAFLVFKSG